VSVTGRFEYHMKKVASDMVWLSVLVNACAGNSLVALCFLAPGKLGVVYVWGRSPLLTSSPLPSKGPTLRFNSL